MFVFIALSTLAVPAMLCAQEPGVKGKGVLLLVDGRRIAGNIQQSLKGYRIRSTGTIINVKKDEVQRWIPESELLRSFGELEQMKRAYTPFAIAQRSIWAFENGLGDQAWPLVARLLKMGEKPAGLAKLYDLAALDLIANTRRRASIAAQSKDLLQSIRKPKGNAIRAAKNEITSRALVHLLQQEARKTQNQQRKLTKSKTKSLPASQSAVRKFGEDALDPLRRKTAREALLRFDRASQNFVYRLAVRYPTGSNRRAIVDQVNNNKLNDDAAVYLGKFLMQTKPALLKTRTADVLGALGSPKALPALEKTKEVVAAYKMRKRRDGSAGSIRAYISITTQQAYVRDFNVEVAQAAAIADPVIDVIRSGVVLDVKVLGVQWTRHILNLQNSLDRAVARIEKRMGK